MRLPWRGLGETLVLLYHRVAQPDGPDPWGLCVTPERFAEHLENLGRYERRDLKALLPGEIPPRRQRGVAITFDDGYRDNRLNALPILERFECPATFFFCTMPIASGTPFWWEAFERNYQGSAEQHLTVYREWQRLADRERLDRLSKSKQLAVPGSAYPMAPGDVASMSRHPLVTVGAHTVTHPVLAGLSADEQQAELSGSKAELERWTGQPVELFSYPYGGPDTYSAATVEAVRRAGFRCGATTQGGRVGRGTDPFRLPRWTVPNLDGEAFAASLRRLSGG